MGQIPRSIERISRMLYSCTHMATVGVKVLIDSRSFSQTKTRNTVRQSASGKFMYCTYVWVWLLHNEERAMTFQWRNLDHFGGSLCGQSVDWY